MHRRLPLSRSLKLGQATQTASKSALDAPSPSDGEVRHTKLPDTFDGIRFEIGRMVKYVQDAAHDPIVQASADWMCREAASMGRDSRDPEILSNIRAIEAGCRSCYVYLNDPPNIEFIQTPRRMVKQTQVPPEVILHAISPVMDAMVDTMGSEAIRGYEPPGITWGDCIPLSQNIIVRDRSSGRYKTVPVGSLRNTWRNYHVVSYNEVSGEFEFKPILQFIDKGNLPVFNVRLSNGIRFRCTGNHKIYVLEKRGSRAPYKLLTMTLDEIIQWKASPRQNQVLSIAIAKKIPEAGLAYRGHPELSDERLWIEGLYAAEGWSEATGKGYGQGNRTDLKKTAAFRTKRAKIGMNDPEAIAELEEKLSVIGQPFGRHERRDGLVTIRMNTSKFTTRLGNLFGASAFEKRFPAWYTSLSREQLEILLSAYALGDGYTPTHGQWARWANLIYNTASETLARQVAFMHLVLGRPISFYRQPAWKTKPVMHRLYEYKGNAEEKVPGIVSSRIVSIEKDEMEPCCDITVADNHNFLLDGGILVHNCDEGSCFVLSHCACKDCGPLLFDFGGHEGTLHHVWGKIHLNQNDKDGLAADLTEPDYKLGDFSRFEHYESVEIPL